MDGRLQEMLDHHEIRTTLAEYCHGCDRADVALMGGVYTGFDSMDDHGAVKAAGPEFAEIMCRSIRERTDAVWHLLGQSLIKIEGDTARAETFFLAFMRLKEELGGRLNQLAGRYVDRLQRVEGRWKIKERVCVRDTSITLKVEEDQYASIGFVAGSRDAGDAGAALLALAHHT